jgi:AcrR family transcriptional regulator
MRQEPKRGNREKLLQASLLCLRENGYARTTARDLVAASGTNLASIGYHFGSKEALLNEAIAVGFREWVDEVEQSAFAPDHADSSQRLERSLAATVDRFAELRPFLIAFVEAFPQAVRSRELRERMAQAYEEARIAGKKMIMSALEADGLRLAPEHAETMSSLLIAVCDGLILQWLLDPERVPSSRELMRALAAVIAVHAEGMRADELERVAPSA